MKPARHAAAPASAQWQKNPERSSLFMLRVMTWLSLRLGRGASRVVLYAIAAYFLAFAPAARRMSRLYLRRVLKLPSNAAVGWRHLFRHFFSFASTIHDRIYLLNDRFDLFDIRVHNQALVDDVLADGQGLFLIGAHLGSFEVLRALGRKRPGLRVAMMMYEENARKINATLSAINPNAQQDIIALGHIGSMIQAHELLAQGTIVGMLGDRSLGNDDTRPLNFLGDPAELPLGPFRMAAIMKRPVLFMTGLYRGGNRYDIHFETLADFSALPPRGRTLAVEAAMTRYAALMEQYCRSAPYNWFNFFDFWQAAAPPLPRKTTSSAETT
ncbi:LpxL/LpxP family acyltransferase [Polaromonas naphthalenivorans]|uniref:Lipid A biosynthesis acyltransferase n=1 Tax=Polaromonas naphthalenivorans (strain CJ2) TaxID=365044 RepID=A1VM13_POLNA|nr:acyl-CoA synthetase [Polaromonas naphthalenivorans]ABM36691.1 lipid A biosynthesis acyltransferase [Polaromonas naphthalenivorans CJ2]